MRDLWRMLAPRNRLLALMGGLLSLGAFGATLFFPKVIQWVSDAAVNDRSFGILILDIGILFLVTGSLSYSSFFVEALVNERLAHVLRGAISRAYIASCLECKEAVGSGEISALIVNDVEQAKSIVSKVFTLLIPGIFGLLSIVIILFWSDFALAFTALFVGLIAALIIAIFASLVQKRSEVSRLRVENVSTVACALVEERLAIACAKAERVHSSRFSSASARLYQARVRLAAVESIGGPINAVLLPALLIAVMIIGMVRVQSEAMTLVALLTFGGYVFLLLVPIGGIFGFVSGYSRAVPSLARLRSFLQNPAGKHVKGRSYGTITEVSTGQGRRLSIDELGYTFCDSSSSIGPLSFDCGPGFLTILKGPNGCGKSTLVKVLAGLYGAGHSGPHGDCVIEMVPQYDFLISGSMQDIFSLANLNYGDELALLSQIGFSSDVLGEGSLLGAGGISLSGGEAKRLSWLRLVSSSADYFILDEPTAGVDAVGRKVLIDLLLAKISTTGLLVVTHDEDFIDEVFARFPCSIVDMS